MIDIIVYRQGSNWIANVAGYLETLHYSYQSKKSVCSWAKEYYPDCNLIFA